MRKSKSVRSPLRWTIFFLLLAALVLLFLPRTWTAPLVNVVQVFLPFFDGARTVENALVDGSALSREPLPISELQQTGCQNQLAALSARVAELETEVTVLTGMRQWQIEGRSLSAGGRLIPARVVATDILPWRDSRLLAAGSLQGVRAGDSITSACFSIDLPPDQGIHPGLAILQAEALVGVVEHVATHSARVRLISDVSIELKVRVGRWTPEGFALLDRLFWLTGRGGGRMQLHDLDRRDVQAGVVAEGDVVLAEAGSFGLPAALVVGRITKIDPDRDNPLLSLADVESAVPLAHIRKVYVYDPSEPASP